MKHLFILEGIDINNPHKEPRGFGEYGRRRDAEARKLVLSVTKPEYQYHIRGGRGEARRGIGYVRRKDHEA